VRAVRILVLACAASLAAVAGPPESSAGRAAPPTIYWLGTEFDGLPLVARPNFPPSFIYERCRPTSGPTCEVDVQNWLLRAHRPSQYAEELRESCVRTVVRGAPAAFFGDHLDVYTGRRAVRIFAATRRQALRAALALRPIRFRERWTGRLPRPVLSVAGALRRCRVLPAPLTG
jgi:hypothetical protein